MLSIVNEYKVSHFVSSFAHDSVLNHVPLSAKEGGENGAGIYVEKIVVNRRTGEKKRPPGNNSAGVGAR